MGDGRINSDLPVMLNSLPEGSLLFPKNFLGNFDHLVFRGGEKAGIL